MVGIFKPTGTLHHHDNSSHDVSKSRWWPRHDKPVRQYKRITSCRSSPGSPDIRTHTCCSVTVSGGGVVVKTRLFLLLRIPTIIKKQRILRGPNLWSQADIYFHMLGANLTEKKERKEKKKNPGALAPSSVRWVRTAFESLSPTHSRAAPKSLCCSYCLCCREYFIRIFQYLFFYFCPCRCLTRPLISYILMHRASRKQVCPPPAPKKPHH